MKINPDPYATLALAPGKYDLGTVKFENWNSWATPDLVGASVTTYGAFYSGFYRFLAVGHLGWHDVVLLSDEKFRRRVRDDGRRLDEPYYDPDTETFRAAWVQLALNAPVGKSGFEVWPSPGLTIKGNGLTIEMESLNSPSEMLRVEGHDNVIAAYGGGGVQSRLILDRAAVVVYGDSNIVTGDIEAEMGCVFFDGNDNLLENAVVTGCAYGDDVAAVNVRGKNGRYGNSMKNVRMRQAPRMYEPIHMVAGARYDDNHRGGTVKKCTAYGFMYGLNGNGATDLKGDFTARYCGTAIALKPHHTTPDVPVKNRVREVK